MLRSEARLSEMVMEKVRQGTGREAGLGHDHFSETRPRMGRVEGRHKATHA